MSEYQCPKCGDGYAAEKPWPCPSCNYGSELAAPAGSEKYHLIDEDWIMQPDDEALNDDCQTWWRLDSHPSGRWMIGAKYNRNLLVPVRRRGSRPPDAIEQMLSQNSELSNERKAQ